MQFVIEFVAEGEYIAKSRCLCEGLSDLDPVRKILKDPTFSHHRVDYSCFYGKNDVDIILTEDQARAALVFKDQCKIKVTVPELAFNKYLYRDVSPRYDECKFLWITRRKLNTVCISYKLNKGNIFGDWMKHGCPLRWDPNHSDGLFPEPTKEKDDA